MKLGIVFVAALIFASASNRLIDRLFDPIYSHFYVEAYPDLDFHYPEKRLRELAGHTFQGE